MTSNNPNSHQQTLEDWRILVVDDQQDNLNLAGAVLSSRGADVALVDNAIAALKLLSEYRPTVILLDLAMPGMDGWQLVKAIRESANRDIPVVALSVRLSGSDTDKALEAGFNGFISKPFTISGIVSQLHDIVEGNRVNHQ